MIGKYKRIKGDGNSGSSNGTGNNEPEFIGSAREYWENSTVIGHNADGVTVSISELPEGTTMDWDGFKEQFNIY